MIFPDRLFSFAMHLCEKSRLPALALQLSLISPAMLILTPHKRPNIRDEWGWKLQSEFVVQRIRARMYNSTNTHGSTELTRATRLRERRNDRRRA